jgi:copper chaperone
MTTETLVVKGMTCTGCVNAVTKALKALDGVVEAIVDLEGQKATVTFDPAKVSVNRLREAIEEAGYDTE